MIAIEPAPIDHSRHGGEGVGPLEAVEGDPLFPSHPSVCFQGDRVPAIAKLA
jgi:hypothetical protein